MSKTKGQPCPVCRRPYTGHLRFTAAEISIEVDGVMTSTGASSITYMHADGTRCRAGDDDGK